MGEVDRPGNLQLQLKFEDPWLDIPELTTLNHSEWLYTPRVRDARAADGGRVFLTFDGRRLLHRRLAERHGTSRTTRAPSPSGRPT